MGLTSRVRQWGQDDPELKGIGKGTEWSSRELGRFTLRRRQGERVVLPIEGADPVSGSVPLGTEQESDSPNDGRNVPGTGGVNAETFSCRMGFIANGDPSTTDA